MGTIALMGKNGGEHGVWMMGNLWWLGKLGEVWGKYGRSGEMCGGGKGRYEKMC